MWIDQDFNTEDAKQISTEADETRDLVPFSTQGLSERYLLCILCVKSFLARCEKI